MPLPCACMAKVQDLQVMLWVLLPATSRYAPAAKYFTPVKLHAVSVVFAMLSRDFAPLLHTRLSKCRSLTWVA